MPIEKFLSISMQLLIGLTGVIVGGFITYFVEKGLQNRQFKKEEKERKETWKCYLEILKQEIEDEHKRLWRLRDSVSGGYPLEYFDHTVKRTILQEIIKTPLFVKHEKVFKKATSLILRYEMINNQSALVRNIISDKNLSIADKNPKLSEERSILYHLVNHALIDDMAEKNDKPDLAVKLEEIQKLI
jgi:hypothetical protein